MVADRPKAEDPDLMNLARGLGASATWRHESAEGTAAEEGAPIHQLIMSSVPPFPDGETGAQPQGLVPSPVRRTRPVTRGG